METPAEPRPQRVGQVGSLEDRIDRAEQAVQHDADDLNNLLEYGRALYLGGMQRPAEPWTQEAVAHWNTLLRKHADEPTVLAYAGSVRFIESREAFLPWEKGRLAKEGEALLNRAVALAPDDLEVRWLRAVTASQLPAFFNADAKAKADFAYLAQALKRRAEEGAGSARGNLEPAMVASVWYHHGNYLQRRGETAAARAAWTQAIDAAPQSGAAEAAAERLGELHQR
ncbi:MAG: hypothetical protein WD294_01105 [Phycisphaeraceae bacterium]